MKRILLLFFALSTLSIGQAQRHFDIQIWNDGEGVCQDSDANVPQMLCYLADNPNGQAIVVCPGGAYCNLSRVGEGTGFAKPLNMRGVSVFVLYYRLPKQRCTVPLADAQQAISIVRRHAQEWGVNPNRIGIMGSSGGGHLPSTAATHFTNADNRPDFQILLYPVITMDPSYTHHFTHDNLLGKNPSKELELLYSNEKQVTEQTPPAFIVLSCTDKVVNVRNALTYANALAEHHVQASLHMYPEGYHGFGSHVEFKDHDKWMNELFQWLDTEIGY